MMHSSQGRASREMSDREIRLATVDDHPFLYSSFIRSAARSMTGVPKWAGPTILHRRMEVLLNRPTCSVHVMCGIPDDDWIMGWIATEASQGSTWTLHWGLTKREHRNEKVFSQLVNASLPTGVRDLIYTHRSKNEDLLQRWGMRYVPWEG